MFDQSQQSHQKQQQDKFSLQWENFNNAQQQSMSPSKTSVSDIYNYSMDSSHKKIPSSHQKINTQHKISNQINLHSELNNSRNIQEISDIFGRSGQMGINSFRFQKEDTREQPKQNQRFDRLYQLLTQAKKNNLDAFYKQIDTQKQYQIQDKFNSYHQFKNYTNKLINEKRQIEELIEKDAQQKKKKQMMKQQFFGVTNTQHQNFTKKQKFESLLPDQYAQENYFQYQEPGKNGISHRQSQQAPIQKFNNFYTGQILQKPQDAFQFFNFSNSPTSKKKEQKPSIQSLQPIRQQKQTILEKTQQDAKLQTLLNNFKKMKYNYQQMIDQLRQNNQQQTKIKQDIKKLKQSKIMLQSQANRSQISQQRFPPIQPTLAKKITNLSIKNNQNQKINDIVYLKINQKIQNLENILKQALNQIKDQKQQKNVPYIQHFDMNPNKQQKHYKSSKLLKQLQSPQNQLNLTQSENQLNKIHNNTTNNKVLGIPQTFSKNTFKNNSRSSHYKSKQQLQKKQSNLTSNNQNYFQPQISLSKNSDKFVGIIQGYTAYNPQENVHYSPFEICLSEPLISKTQEYINQQFFFPKQNSEQYFPKQFKHQQKNLRKCLSQKSSVIYDSFDFYLTAKFTKVEDFLHPVIATIRVSNKCTFDLYDVHTIVYGSQGPGIHTDPTSIYQQQLQNNSNFSFHVYLNKSCLQNNSFSIQISYKTDSMPKKKVNIKVLLPLLYLAQPLFIHEQQFNQIWEKITKEYYVRPQKLNPNNLRSYQDLKLILPFIQISQLNQNIISFGLVFKYPKSNSTFLLKIQCYTNGRASLHIKSNHNSDNKLRQQVLNVLSFVLFDCQ